jgi:hypothetical protein
VDSTNTDTSDPALALAISTAVKSSPSLAKKRAEFKVRLEKAKEGMPPGMTFVVFTDPQKDCASIARQLLVSLELPNASR